MDQSTVRMTNRGTARGAACTTTPCRDLAAAAWCVPRSVRQKDVVGETARPRGMEAAGPKPSPRQGSNMDVVKEQL